MDTRSEVPADGAPESGSRVRWQVRALSKLYPTVLANDNVSLDLRSHEIHGLLGENGCGKSTLIGMLSGTVRPTSGTIETEGQLVQFASTQQARQAGIATVFQEFSLVQQLSVAENILLGQPPPRTSLGLIDHDAIRRRAQAVLDDLDIADDIDVDQAVSELSVAQQQLVEIAKAVSLGGQTLILDEPTAALSVQEIESLHKLLRRLKSAGQSILYVSHRLDEVVEIVDCATILRDGKVVSSRENTPLTVDGIISSMINAASNSQPAPRSRSAARSSLVLRQFEAEGVERVDLEVKEGEILGLAGVMGSGRTALLRGIFGDTRIHGGSMTLLGTGFLPRTPREAVERGVGFVPENRKTDALFFNLPCTGNVTLPALRKLSTCRWISGRRETVAFARYQELLGLPEAANHARPAELSGGNQQKLLLARWLFAESRLLLLDEPTNGIDLNAKASIYHLVRQAASEGRTVIWASSDLEELLHQCDRIATIHTGRITGIHQARDLDERALAEAITTSGLDEHSLTPKDHA